METSNGVFYKLFWPELKVGAHFELIVSWPELM